MSDSAVEAFALGFYLGVQATEAADFSDVCPDEECGYDPESQTCSNPDCPVGD